jgi:hypothetical protein
MMAGAKNQSGPRMGAGYKTSRRKDGKGVKKMVRGKMKYVVQADYENGETLFIAKSEKPPVLNVDEAQTFFSEQAAEKIAKEKNDSACGLVWEVAEY